jgi:predicted small secreted protein
LAWDPNANGPVRSIAISGTTVFSGGNFTNIGNQNRNHIAALDVITGNALAWNPNVDSAVRSITIIGTMVYVGGSFVNIGGQGRNYIAALDITSGNVLTWNPNANCPVNSIVVSGTTVYAGGEFTGIGGQSRSNIAALDVATGNATGWNPNANNSVFSFAVSGKSVYIGGKFTTIGGQNRRGIAAVDTVTGSVFDWDPSASDSCCIYSLAVNATTVYAGGYFQVIGGQFRNHIAALDVTTGNATAWNPNAGSLVYSLALSGTSVYVGGDFRTIGGQSRNFIASVDAATGNVLDWNPNSNKAVNSLAASGTTVYAGGNFDSIGGQSRNYIAALDASTGNILTWNAHASNYVYSLSLSGTTLYAGGSFDSMGGLFRNHIAAIDASTGNILSWNPNSDNFVYALAVSGTSIFAGGIFTDIGQGIGRAFFAQLGNFLSAPKLAAPANGSSGQPTGITLSWNAVSGASAYHLQLSLSPDFNMPLVDDSTLTVMSKTIGSLSNGATYYWRVSGSNTHGISLWSEIWNFSVIPQAPGAPLLLFPTNNALDVSTKPMVKWHRVNNTTSYYVLVAADSLFASIIFQDSTTIDTFKVCGQLANYTKYFWRVEAANAGGIGIWSSIYSFTTIVTIPSVVHLKAPEMGDTIKIDSVVLTWSKGVPQADLYSVEYASDSSFTVPTIDSSIIDTARLVRNLKNNSAIWWRVKSHNAAGWGDWSVKSMFAVKFISTRSGLSGLPKVFSFSISSMTGSIRYTLPKTEHVVFQIYSIKGQLQSEPLNKQQEAGYYTVNIHYGSIAAGSYLMVFRAGAYYQKKMVFLRK